MKDERLVGTLRCGEVLERLPDYIDGRLDDAERARVEEHLRGCDRCERFGNVYQRTVGTLREQLTAGEPVSPALLERLRARLDEERGS